MTKEEQLKQEAEEKSVEWFKNNVSAKNYETPFTERYCYELGYLAGAEPREKQIQIDAEQIRALQKQNGELTDKVKELEKQVKYWQSEYDKLFNEK